MDLLAHGATRAGTAASNGQGHGGRLRSSRARPVMNVMNVHLPAANEGQGGALHERTAKKQSPAAQPRTCCGTTSCAAPPVGALHRDWARCAVEVELVRGRAGWLPWRGAVAVARGGCRGERRLESRNRGGQPKVHPLL
jgi:hypothetical protein